MQCLRELHLTRLWFAQPSTSLNKIFLSLHVIPLSPFLRKHFVRTPAKRKLIVAFTWRLVWRRLKSVSFWPYFFSPLVYFSALAPLVPFSHLSIYPFYHDNVSCKVRGRGRFLTPPESHSHEGTGKPRKTCADTVRHCLWHLIFVIDISITNTNTQSSTSHLMVRCAS